LNTMQMISCKPLMIATILIGLFSPMSVFSAPSDIDTADRQSHTRSLAATCAACHSQQQPATQINAPYMPLYGMDKQYFLSQMQAFKTGERASTIMHRHAKGLNTQEIADLADYFSGQKLGKASALPHQRLLKTQPN
jgi:sulfide dehydrogenase cytochrome subunit